MIHEGRIVAHFRWQGAEQMADALLVLNVDVKVVYQNDAAIRADTLFATLNSPDSM